MKPGDIVSTAYLDLIEFSSLKRNIDGRWTVKGPDVRRGVICVIIEQGPGSFENEHVWRLLSVEGDVFFLEESALVLL